METKTQKTATKKATATTTKVTDSVKLSSLDKKMIRLGELKAKQEKEALNLVEIKSVLNILLMLEDKNPSQLYNKLNNAKGEIKQYVKLALGKSPMPKYGEFLAELTKKHKPLYANYDGITVLTRFNKAAQLKTKAEKQNKVVAAI